MAQKQGVNPQQPPAPGDVSLEELQAVEQDVSLGDDMPKGSDKESIKQRLMLFFQKAGIFEKLPDNMSKSEFIQEINKFATLVSENNFEQAKKSPLYPIIEQLGSSLTDTLMQKQQPQQQAAPTNFAGMMPPGGGMSGR